MDSAGYPILACYDGSPAARAAIERVAELHPGAGVTVCTAWAPFRYWMGVAPYPPEAANLNEDIEANAVQLAEQGAAYARGLGLRARAEVLRSEVSVARAVAERACCDEFALVALGNVGHSAIGGALLGSVASAVTHRCPTSVLLVRPHEARAA